MIAAADESASTVPPPPANVAEGSGEADLDLGYQVRLDAFSGPLDLLLYLVRRAEVDIVDIPITEIADQFVATVRAWEDMDLEVAGDFIMMAATLLEIKARTIAPPPEDDDLRDDEDDHLEFAESRESLIQQLLRYRRFKDAVGVLDALENEHVQRHHRRFQEQIPEDPEADESYDLENADPYALYKFWDRIVQTIAGTSDRRVVYDDIPIEERVQTIVTIMREAREGQMDWLMQSVDSTIKRIGVFVASLECVRKRLLECTQHEQYGPIYLRYREEDERQRQAPLPPLPEEDGTSKRRRRKLQLVTYHGPIDEDGVQQVLPECEEELVIESDEQRFVRELNEASQVDELLTRMKDLDAHVHAHLVEAGIVDAPSESEAADAEEQAEAGTELAPDDRLMPPGEGDQPGEGNDEDDDDEYDDDDDDEDEYDDDDEDEYDDDDDDDNEN